MRIPNSILMVSLIAMLLPSTSCHAQPNAPILSDSTSPRRVELADTEVVYLPARDSGRKYEIWISFPANHDPARTYPVVLATDALYSFPIIRSVRNLLGQGGRNIEDFILIGLPPERGLTSQESRSRDYTLSDPHLNPENDQDDYTASTYGQADIYRDYLETHVIPYVRDVLNGDTSRMVFIGHSYGGLLGAHILLTKPSLFQKYILGSPSFWFNRDEILGNASEYAQMHTDLRAEVFMYAGEYETFGPTPRHFEEVDLTGKMQAFEKILKNRNYPGLKIRSDVLRDEDHFTIFPSVVSKGLILALPGRGPYSSG